MSAITASSPVSPRTSLPLLEQCLIGAVVVGAVAWSSLSALPGAAAGLGWLVVLPLASLLTAFLLRLSRRRHPGASSVRVRRRRQAVSVRAWHPARGSARMPARAIPARAIPARTVATPVARHG